MRGEKRWGRLAGPLLAFFLALEVFVFEADEVADGVIGEVAAEKWLEPIWGGRGRGAASDTEEAELAIAPTTLAAPGLSKNIIGEDHGSPWEKRAGSARKRAIQASSGCAGCGEELNSLTLS